MRRVILALLILTLPTVAIFLFYFFLKPKPVPTRRDATGQVLTLAGAGYPGAQDGDLLKASFSDPFGIAVDSRGTVYVADAGESNNIRRITDEGRVETIAGSAEGYADGDRNSARFNTPSGLCIDRRGNIIIADTANNRIRKIDPKGTVSTLAGNGEAGLRDGAAPESQFDSPLGVAADAEGNVYVADSYNDCIRKISIDGQVTTIAGGRSPGLADGQKDAALFDTPSGIAVDSQGNLFVADTGNDRIRRITPQGEVTTFAGNEASGDIRRLHGPTGITVTHDGFLFVTERDSGLIRRITPEGDIEIYAGSSAGFRDGRGREARFNSPAGIAVDRRGNLFVADSANYFIRVIAPSFGPLSETKIEEFIQPSAESTATDASQISPRLDAIFTDIANFPWPLAPQDVWHEVTGVIGEARGAPNKIALHHLHSGLDIRGAEGEAVLSVMDEKVSAPIANWDKGGAGEGIHVGLMSYIHIRVGRNAKDEIQHTDKFKPVFDQSGKIARIRVRRGTRFKVGDFIGTLNALNHVHLNFGPWNAQANPIRFPLPAFKDTVPPTIETGGIAIVSRAGEVFKQKIGDRLAISGDVDIVMTAYDRVDGNGPTRKLGLYKAGYQLLREDGSAVPGFEQPLVNLEFNRLPPGDEAVFLVYAAGSGVSAYGTPTKFRYIITNRVRDGEARDGALQLSNIAPGNYVIRVVAEDFAGNRTTGEIAVAIGR
ncbi:MAG: NHL repeat-containing protein [Acidobacteriota bacterium]